MSHHPHGVSRVRRTVLTESSPRFADESHVGASRTRAGTRVDERPASGREEKFDTVGDCEPPAWRGCTGAHGRRVEAAAPRRETEGGVVAPDHDQDTGGGKEARVGLRVGGGGGEEGALMEQELHAAPTP
ncbi:LOW QUALITY PROTEIN: hypothetical protein ACHAW5_001288 [Stephanodiscus triporus]|uniref:Uncharacterized protein n=1 Tax=Stephanodiscus triporus TaxID=2934178 RepID=A0ABD3MWR9_9STRA